MPATRSYQYDVFISYSSKDRDWVRTKLLPYLEQHGLRVCIDYRDFEIGVPSLVNMENAVKRSRRTLLVLTPNWIASEWTDFEALLIQTSDPSGHKRRVLPLMVQACPLPDRLRIFYHLDLTNPAEFDLQMQRLVKTIKAKTRLPQPAPVEPTSAPSPQPSAPAASGVHITGNTIYIGGDVVGRDKSSQQPASVPEGQAAARSGAPISDIAPPQLRQLLDSRFSLEELRTLCFDLDVEYENLPGEGKAAKARELIAHMQRHGRMPELVAAVRRARQDI